MKRQIRRNVFETNSSSTHSLCITKNDVLNQKVNSLHLSTGEYGWEWELYKNSGDKANYLYTALMYLEREEDLAKFIGILDNNGIEVTFSEKSDEYWENGYVDHADDLSDFIKDVLTDENKLMRFLFSSESYVQTGNDNTDTCDLGDCNDGSWDCDDCEYNTRREERNYEHTMYYKGN